MSDYNKSTSKINHFYLNNLMLFELNPTRNQKTNKQRKKQKVDRNK